MVYSRDRVEAGPRGSAPDDRDILHAGDDRVSPMGQLAIDAAEADRQARQEAETANPRITNGAERRAAWEKEYTIHRGLYGDDTVDQWIAEKVREGADP